MPPSLMVLVRSVVVVGVVCTQCIISGVEVMSAVSSIHGCDPRTFQAVQLALRLQWAIEMLVVSGFDFRINLLAPEFYI